MTTPFARDQAASRYAHCTPPDAIDKAAGGDDLADALAFVLHGLRGEHAAQLVDRRASGGRADSALLFVLNPGVVLVVGRTALAVNAREVLADRAIGGWRLHQLPDEVTPLHTVQHLLDSRCYGLLVRNGFTAVEEVTVIPDKCLMTLRNAGPRFLAQVRRVVRAAKPGNPVMHQASKVDQRLADLEDRLSEAAVLRYRDFIAALSRTSIPTAALEKIADALNGEPLPPADTTVTLLLATANEPFSVTAGGGV